MKRLMASVVITLLGISVVIPAYAELKDQPWQYLSYSYVKVDRSTYIKACYWKKSEYVNGIYSAVMATTYTHKKELVQYHLTQLGKV